jgi:hypothetical protein
VALGKDVRNPPDRGIVFFALRPSPVVFSERKGSLRKVEPGEDYIPLVYPPGSADDLEPRPRLWGKQEKEYRRCAQDKDQAEPHLTDFLGQKIQGEIEAGDEDQAGQAPPESSPLPLDDAGHRENAHKKQADDENRLPADDQEGAHTLQNRKGSARSQFRRLAGRRYE